MAPIEQAGNISTPNAITVDSAGSLWFANKGGNTLSTFSNSGAAGSTYPVGAAPTALAFDSTGNLFVANSGSTRSVTVRNSTGVTLQTITTAAEQTNLSLC